MVNIQESIFQEETFVRTTKNNICSQIFSDNKTNHLLLKQARH